MWEISVIIVVVDLVLIQSHFGSSNASATNISGVGHRPIHCIPRPQADSLWTPATGPSIAVAKDVIERDEGSTVVPTSSLMAVASQLAIGMSLPINCQLFNDAACSSQWPHELRKAWRQYCDEFGEVDRDPHQFANAALMIARSNPKGAAAVFQGNAALRCITTPPGVKQVAYFYDKIVDTAKYPLGMLIKRAASEHLVGRSLDFVLLAGSYVFFFAETHASIFPPAARANPAMATFARIFLREHLKNVRCFYVGIYRPRSLGVQHGGDFLDSCFLLDPPRGVYMLATTLLRAGSIEIC